MLRLTTQKMTDMSESPCQDESPEIPRFGHRGQFKKMFWSVLQQFNSSARDCRGLGSFCYRVEVVRCMPEDLWLHFALHFGNVPTERLSDKVQGCSARTR